MSDPVLSAEAWRRPGLIGEVDLLLGSVGDVIVLLAGEGVLGMPIERDCAFAMRAADWTLNDLGRYIILGNQG